MKKYLILSLFLTNQYIYCQSNHKAEEFDKELQLFIDSTKINFNKAALPYLVFVSRFTSSKENFCFTISYLLNSGELRMVAPNFIYYYKNLSVVISVDSSNYIPD